MKIEEMLSKGMIKSFEADEKEIKKVLDLSERDLKVAKKNFESNEYDWSLAVAYNSALQAGKALMLSRSYRPAGEFRHVAVVEFVHSEFGKQITDKMIDILSSLRKRRHRVVYEQAGSVSEGEAIEAIKFVDNFVSKVKEILKI